MQFRRLVVCLAAVLAGVILQAPPLKAQGAPGDYKLHAGDKIQVSVWKEVDLQCIVIIRPDGTSSLRYKNNVENLPLGLETIAHLRPVTFNWKTDGASDLGFVAEEVNQVSPLLTTLNKEGQIEGVKYDRISAVLVKAVQDQQQQIAELKTQNAAQPQEIAQMKRSAAPDQPFNPFNLISVLALGGVIVIGVRQKRGGQA